jgi:hypothetical protein
MSKIDERAREYSARVSGGFILDDRVAAYKSGFQDAMLTEEDIGTIFRISSEILASKPTEVQMGIEGDPEHYAEVLKRFNEIKFKK